MPIVDIQIGRLLKRLLARKITLELDGQRGRLVGR